MKLRLFFLLFTIFILLEVSSIAEQKIAILAGGSCNTAQNNDNFVPIIANWANYLLTNGWKVKAFFDIKQQPKLKKYKFPFQSVEMKDFDWDEFKAYLQDIRNVDQVLIVISSHGEKNNHGLCSNDEKYHPVTDLKSAFKKLHDSNVQLAFFDDSCYGGNSIDILDSNLYCVFSLAGRNHSGTASFSNHASQLLSGKICDLNNDNKISIEEYFLSVKRINNYSLMYSTISDDHPVIRDYDKNFGLAKNSYGANFTPNMNRELLREYLSNKIQYDYMLSKIGYSESDANIAQAFYKSNSETPYIYQEPVVTAINYLIYNYGNKTTSSNVCSKYILD